MDILVPPGRAKFECLGGVEGEPTTETYEM